jgi:hypothetical protein
MLSIYLILLTALGLVVEMFLGSGVRPVREADNLKNIHEPIV